MSQQRVVRVAAAQLSPDLEKAQGTLEKVLGAIEDAANKGAQLIVFPETFVPRSFSYSRKKRLKHYKVIHKSVVFSVDC